MKKNATELVMILDRSGSMYGMEKDTIGGFNAMIDKQRNLEGEVWVSTVLFNDETQVIHDRVPISEVAPMTEKDYIPGGTTALIDAIGGAVHHIRNVHRYIREEDVPEHTIFVITTDGLENASHKYTLPAVREMLEREKKEHGWEFIFLGANIDAIKTADAIGIAASSAANYVSDQKGTLLNYEAMAEAVSSIRKVGKLNPKWKAKVEADAKQRKTK